jgi:hypothetical protein
MIRMIAMVSSICSLLRAGRPGALAGRLSNACATYGRVAARRRLTVVLVVLAAILGAALPAHAQPSAQESSASGLRASTLGRFLFGGAAALGAHESGHLLFDGIFNAHPGIAKVSFHGVPFFAITHDSGLPNRKEFVIDSAGFWVQHATNELILHAHPRLRDERQPFLKGMYAFNVLASVAYAGAAFARTGPVERDTRGMADSARIKEPWIAALILAPAVLVGVRYFHPQAKWAAWGSRGVKAGMVLLVFR